MEFAEIYLELRHKGSKLLGGSVAKNYEGHIELFDWSWGLSLDNVSPDGRSAERQAKCNMVAISKPVDAASTALLSILKSGDTCDTAVLTMAQTTQRSIALKLVLKNVRLMSYDLEVECSDTEVVLSEEWEMSYDHVSIIYQSQEARLAARSGSSQSAARTFQMQAPPGVSQDEPVRSPRVSGLDSDGVDSGLSKDEIIKLIDEQLKKKKLI